MLQLKDMEEQNQKGIAESGAQWFSASRFIFWRVAVKSANAPASAASGNYA